MLKINFNISALFVLLLTLVFFSGSKVYSAETCTWAGDASSCAPYDSAAFATLQSACDGVKQGIADAKKSLCGDIKYFSGDAGCKDPAITPFGVEGGIWGAFKQHCDSDEGDLGTTGMCLYLDRGADNYKFIWSGQTQPPTKSYCSAGSIKCPKDGSRTLLSSAAITDILSGVAGAGTLVGTGGNVLLGAGAAYGVHKALDNSSMSVKIGRSGRIERKWLRKYGGFAGGGVPEKKVRHKTDSSSETSDLTDEEKDDLEDAQGFADQDNNRGTACENACIKYWKVLDTINDTTILDADQTALDAMCQPPCTTAECICAADPKCACETNDKGHWLATTKKCICKGLTASAWDECLCTEGSGGIFISGHCDHKGTGTLPTYDGNGNPINNGNTASNDSTGASDQASLSGAGASGLAGLGGGAAGDEGAGTVSSGGSGKTWYSMLQREFGSTNAGTGQKFGAAGKGGNYGAPGGGSSSSTKKGSSLGVNPASTDLFVVISKTYTSQYTSGGIAEPAGGNKNASKTTINSGKLGTTPISF